MKTTLQEFLEYLEGIEKRDNLPSWIITTGKNYLEQEKQQIIDAYSSGEIRPYNGKQYYDSTFGNSNEAGI